MALLDVVFRVLNKAATAFIEPRTEDGHGSAVASPSYGEIVTGGAVVSAANPLEVHDNKTELSTLFATIADSHPAIVSRGISEESLTAEGKYSDRFIINKFGRNPDVDTGTTPEDIWSGGGVYTGFPTGAAETLNVFSSDVNDTAAGTGARTIRIFGLDSSWNLIQEDVTMNGTTAVTTVQTFYRVYRAYALTAGSNGTNIGTITIQHTTTIANVFALILPGYGQSALSCYTIPAGYTGYLRYFSSSLIDNNSNFVQMIIWYRENGAAVRELRPFAIGQNYNAVRQIYGGLVMQEKSDFIFRAVSASSTNADVTVGWDMVCVKN